MAYELTYGPLLSGAIFVRHRCDNPPCCNPAHLLAGTHADNMRDMAERGRSCKDQLGSKGHAAKLTEADIVTIREDVASGVPRKLLQDKYGISKGGLCDIVNCVTWRHVPDTGAPIRAARKAAERATIAQLVQEMKEALASFDPDTWTASFMSDRGGEP